jgi:hypothetical protein
MRLLIMSCISGVLSYLSVSLPHFLAPLFDISDDALFLLPGVIFGILVLVPLVKKTHYRALRWLGLLIFSIGAWFVAVSIGIQVLPLVKQTPILSCGISGSIGVLILAAASRYLVPFNFYVSSILIALFVGFLGGSIIGMAFSQPRASLASESLYFIGFLFWHCGVAVSLFGRPRAINEEKQESRCGAL